MQGVSFVKPFFSSILIFFLFLTPLAYSYDELFSEESSTHDSLEQTIITVGNKYGKVNKGNKVLPPRRMKEYIFSDSNKFIKSINTLLVELVKDAAAMTNDVFQTKLNNIYNNYSDKYAKKLAKKGLSKSYSSSYQGQYCKIWLRAINMLVKQEKNKEQENSTFDTTVLNILLRKEVSGQETNCAEYVEKIQTLLLFGASKNLNPHFKNIYIASQSEHPIAIILNEVKECVVNNLLSVWANDTIRFNEEEDCTNGECFTAPFIRTFEENENKNHIMNNLIDKRDIAAFDLLATYLEKHNMFMVEPYSKQIAGISGQIQCRPLEYLLGLMVEKRNNASSHHGSKKVDNISELWKTKHFSEFYQTSNIEARFSKLRRDELEMNFDREFSAIAEKIRKEGRPSDFTKSPQEYTGEVFKQQVIEWCELAEFCTRIATHLWHRAVTSSEDPDISNMVTMIRYANIHQQNQKGLSSDDSEMFRELRLCGGNEIIFKKKNRYHWDPAMFSMIHKRYMFLPLVLKQTNYDPTDVDGVFNNIFHLSVAKKSDLLSTEEENQDNVLNALGQITDKKDIREKTFTVVEQLLQGGMDEVLMAAALRSENGLHNTPVSLAAARGYFKVFDLMKLYLLKHGLWHSEEHGVLSKTIEEILLKGMKSYLQNNEPLLSELEKDEISEKIEKVERKVIKKAERNTVPIYNYDSPKAVKNMRLIIEPTRAVLDDYEIKADSLDMATSPYKQALSIAIKTMLEPKKIKKISYEVKLVEPPIEDKPKKKKKNLFSFFTAVPSKKTEKRPEPILERVKKVKRVDGPLANLKHSSNDIKFSYLVSVLDLVLDRYLENTIHPHKIKLAWAYKAITENQTKNFFERFFNPSIEKRAQQHIKNALKKAGRLEEEIEIKESLYDNVIMDDAASFDASESYEESDCI